MVKIPIDDMYKYKKVYVPIKNMHTQYNISTWSQGLSIPPENMNR